MNFIIDPQRGPHIRDYSDQSQEMVVICADNGYWTADEFYHKSINMAGVFTRDEAYAFAGNFGPERRCSFHNIPADHIPTLRAEAERLRVEVDSARNISANWLAGNNAKMKRLGAAEALQEIIIEVMDGNQKLEDNYLNALKARRNNFREMAQATLAAHPHKKEGE